MGGGQRGKKETWDISKCSCLSNVRRKSYSSLPQPLPHSNAPNPEANYRSSMAMLSMSLNYFTCLAPVGSEFVSTCIEFRDLKVIMPLLMSISIMLLVDDEKQHIKLWKILNGNILCSKERSI